MPEVSISAFGQRVELLTPDDDFAIADAVWRLKNIYQPYACIASSLATDVALDIGAGFGSFCIPFAAANPSTTVYAFEPQKDFFDLLIENVQRYSLTNIVAINAAVLAEIPETMGMAKGNSQPPPVFSLNRLDLPCHFNSERCALIRHLAKKCFLQFAAHCEDLDTDKFELFCTDAFLVQDLASLSPGVVKIIAPGQEEPLIRGLHHLSGIQFLCESWSYVHSSAVYVEPTRRVRGMVRLAGSSLALNPPERVDVREGLDIIIPTYNAKAYLLECIQSLLVADRDDIRVIVVDDGSTDGCVEKVSSVIAGDGRVRIERKLNGGCASARNYGRLMSNASHIAFVDADDTVSPDFFAHLLELSRYTGAEIVQGEFDFMEMEADGQPRYRSSSEKTEFADLPRFSFEYQNYVRVANSLALMGQPTIWRRIYRRDFLDAKNIWFPEHIRSFDDQYFQLLSVHHAGEIFTLLGPHYHYRQHPAQDIKQFDERHFYELEMFRMVTKRSVQEGWNNFSPILRSLVNTINWSVRGLRQDLVGDFLKGAAELWIYLYKSMNQKKIMKTLVNEVEHYDFKHYVQRMIDASGKGNDYFSWVYLDSYRFHPSMMVMNVRNDRS